MNDNFSLEHLSQSSEDIKKRLELYLTELSLNSSIEDKLYEDEKAALFKCVQVLDKVVRFSKN